MGKPHVKRIYERASKADGLRILVDRLWPRGLSRERARLDHWLKEIAPSDELRRWFGHDPAKWDEFKARYFRELDEQPELIAQLRELIRTNERVTLLYSSREFEFNNAVALKLYLERSPEL